MGFFKTASMLSEMHESGDFQDILAFSGEVESKIVIKQTYNFIFEIMGLLGHCFGLYLTAEGQNVQEIARFVRFAQSRYF